MPRVVHFEIHADDPERAIQFYRELLGWEFSRWEGPWPYWMIKTGDCSARGIDGGLLKRQQPRTGNDAVVAYVGTVDVDDIDRYVARGVELGGKISFPKTEIPHVGWLAYLQDPEGNVFGMMQFLHEEERPGA